MLIAMSKVTSQGQISVPAAIRQALGIRAGTELCWDLQENGDFVIRPKRVTLEDLHELVGPPQVRLSDKALREARKAFQASRALRVADHKG